MTRTNALWLTTLTFVLTSLLACQSGHDYKGQRTEVERTHLRSLNDSLTMLTPNALPLIRQAMSEAADSLTWYDYYLLYGRHYLLTNTPDSVLPYATRTLRFAQAAEPQSPRTRGLAALALSTRAAFLYLMHHDADSVVATWKQAYSLMMEGDIKDDLPDMSANLGDAYVSKGDIPEAAHWYRRALFLVDSLALPQSRNLTLYMGLGRIYTTLKDYEQAREYYEMADAHFDEMKPNMQSYFLNNYGNYFYFTRQYDKALQTFMRLKGHLAQYHADEHFDHYLCAINLADVYLNLHHTDSARHYVNEAEEYFSRQGVAVGVYYAHTIRIGIALQEHRYNDIRAILQAEGDLHISDNDLIGIRQRYLSLYHAAVGDYQDAYSVLAATHQHRDSAESYRQHLRSRDIMIQLTEDTMRLHHQLAVKEREATYARSRATLWLLLSLMVIGALMFVLWVNYERKRHLQNKLEIIKLRLMNARQRISPHFVFNVLNSCMTRNDNTENDRLLMLSKLIRSNLDLTSQEQITLAEELDFVRQYVEIERTLIGDDFTFTIEAPARERLKQVVLPSMLVQIMTENAIVHAIKGREGDKQLHIVVEQDGRQTRISVIDNGPGFDIRKANERSRTGLSIIRTTIAAVNQHSRHKRMHFNIHNDHGCHAVLTVEEIEH